MKNFALIVIAMLLFAIGLIGLVIPIIPGVLFLLLGALVVAAISPRLRARMSRHPRFKRLFARLERGQQLDLFSRCKLAFWATLATLSPNRSGNNR